MGHTSREAGFHTFVCMRWIKVFMLFIYIVLSTVMMEPWKLEMKSH